MSFRLEIDGSTAHVSESDSSSCPQIELPLFTASVSSIHSDESTRDQKRTTTNFTTNIMTRKRYNHLCGNILVILLTQGAILLAVLVTFSCSFYRVRIEDDVNDAVTFDIGLFRYSVTSEASSQQSQCALYGASSTDKGSTMEELLNKTESMLKVPQFLSMAAPVIAMLVCLCLAFQMLKPQKCCCRWYTGISLFLAALFQALIVICFQGQSVCNNTQDILSEDRTQTCEYSSGSRLCIIASVFYGVTAIFAFLVPADGPQSTTKEQKENQSVAKGSTGSEIEQKESEEEAATNDKCDSQDIHMQKADDVCLQMEDDSERSDDEKNLERVGSFETSVTEPTASSPSRETDTSSLYISDHPTQESMPVEDIDDGDRPFDVEHNNNDLMLDSDDLEQQPGRDEPESDSESCSNSSESTTYPDLAFDLM